MSEGAIRASVCTSFLSACFLLEFLPVWLKYVGAKRGSGFRMGASCEHMLIRRVRACVTVQVLVYLRASLFLLARIAKVERGRDHSSCSIEMEVMCILDFF